MDQISLRTDLDLPGSHTNPGSGLTWVLFQVFWLHMRTGGQKKKTVMMMKEKEVRNQFTHQSPTGLRFWLSLKLLLLFPSSADLVTPPPLTPPSSLMPGRLPVTMATRVGTKANSRRKRMSAV